MNNLMTEKRPSVPALPEIMVITHEIYRRNCISRLLSKYQLLYADFPKAGLFISISGAENIGPPKNIVPERKVLTGPLNRFYNNPNNDYNT